MTFRTSFGALCSWLTCSVIPFCFIAFDAFGGDVSIGGAIFDYGASSQNEEYMLKRVSVSSSFK